MAIDNLSRRGRRKGEPLPPAPAPEAIPAERIAAPRDFGQDGGSGGGIDSPLTEQENTSGWYHFTSSDGLFVIEVPVQTEYRDAFNREIIVIHRDQSAE